MSGSANGCASTADGVAPAPTGVMAWTLAFLERVRYRVLSSPGDAEMLRDLRWRYYREAGTLIDPEMTADEFVDGKDDLPTARTIGVHFDGRLVATLRAHAITAETAANAAAVDVLPHLVEREARNGKRFVFASRWTSEPDMSNSLPLMIATMRTSCLAAGHHRAHHVLSVSRENHVKAYKRLQDAEVWSAEPVQVEGMNYRHHLVASDYGRFRRRMFVDRQAYLSSRREREALFGLSADPEAMVLPSASAVLAGTEEFGD